MSDVLNDFPNPFPPSTLPDAQPGANDPALYQYVRALLTGDPFGASPATNIIDFYAGDTLPEMFRAYSCTSMKNGEGVLVVSDTLTADDLRYFYRAVAISIVIPLLSGTSGGEFQERVIKTTTNNVDETVQSGRTLNDALIFLQTEKARMLARIPCIAKARASSPPLQLFDVVKTRHRVDSRYPCNVYPGSGVSSYSYGWFWDGVGLGLGLSS